MKATKITVELTFTEPLLGSATNNRELYTEFIASKAPTVANGQEEVEALPLAEQIEKAMTVFPRDGEKFHLWDYQVRGFLKEALGVRIELGDSEISKWQYKRAVDSLVFVTPRRIYILDENGHPWTKAPEQLQRPLRAETRQGDRVALANSEVLPAGCKVVFTIMFMEGSNKKTKLALFDRETLVQLLDYGALKGFGQWRSGGYGRFTWKELAQETPVSPAPLQNPTMAG